VDATQAQVFAAQDDAIFGDVAGLTRELLSLRAIVLAARDVGGVVLLQATLTFIGIGGGSVWGEMLSQGRNWIIGPGGSMLGYWWVFLPPTFAVMLFGIAWNMLGDSLNDVLDPTAHHARPGRSFWRRKKKEQTDPLPAEEALRGPASAIQPAQTSFAVEPVEKTSHPNGTDPVLRAARESVARGDLPQALHAYSHLIRRNRSIGDVLPDLAQLVKKFGPDPNVWQTLGDALARAGDAHHADQSYKQARKLRQG
jgi:hypothetical protein